MGFNTSAKIADYLLQNLTRGFDHKEQYWRKCILYSAVSSDVFSCLYRLYNPDFATIHMHICDSLSHRYWMAYEPEKFSDISSKDIRRFRDVIPKGYMQADKAIGKILNSIGGDVNVVLASDHGFQSIERSLPGYDLNVEF